MRDSQRAPKKMIKSKKETHESKRDLKIATGTVTLFSLLLTCYLAIGDTISKTAHNVNKKIERKGYE